MRKLWPLLIVLGGLVCSPGSALGNDRQAIFTFAEALFAEQDYYRAITEYKRFLHLAPTSADAPRAALRIGQSLLAGERWRDADAALQRILRDYPHSAAAAEAALLRPEIAYRQNRFSLAGEQFRQLADSDRPAPIREQARYRLAWTAIERRDFAAARLALEPLQRPQAEGLAAALASRQPPAEKSPALAGALSGLLPGAGQLYTGHYRDAGLAFVLNGTFIWAAVEAFENDNQVLGGILAFFEVGWYGGNIYNAINHAHRYNQERFAEEKRGLRERFGLELQVGPQAGLMKLHGRF